MIVNTAPTLKSRPSNIVVPLGEKKVLQLGETLDEENDAVFIEVSGIDRYSWIEFNKASASFKIEPPESMEF